MRHQQVRPPLQRLINHGRQRVDREHDPADRRDVRSPQVRPTTSQSSAVSRRIQRVECGNDIANGGAGHVGTVVARAGRA